MVRFLFIGVVLALMDSGSAWRSDHAAEIRAAAANLTSSYCTSNMESLNSVAKSNSEGKSPDGYCYSHVADYIDATGYGG